MQTIDSKPNLSKLDIKEKEEKLTKQEKDLIKKIVQKTENGEIKWEIVFGGITDCFETKVDELSLRLEIDVIHLDGKLTVMDDKKSTYLIGGQLRKLWSFLYDNQKKSYNNPQLIQKLSALLR